jgi:hypothetical protein
LSMNRRYRVPLPTRAAAATSSIVTPATPRLVNSRSAAASTRSRLRAASARSRTTGRPSTGSSGRTHPVLRRRRRDE